ncbi:MAG TPA: class I SAM-dependent methyltransferase, partial [Dehalococcoidia bacterium]|nr:class I SAM-dependent methyltransferase [Dehalococcoidia bacterium]
FQAAGEHLPFADHRFDLATVALSFHWLHRGRFLPEARRVLRPSGWLVIYDNFFLGQMKENAEFERWEKEEYLTRYPPPPRDSHPLTDEAAASHGFLFVRRETYANEVTFSADELSSYLMTQTGVVAAIQGGNESPEYVYAWLVDSTKPLFPQQRCNFRFGGHIWYLRPNPLYSRMSTEKLGLLTTEEPSNADEPYPQPKGER